MPLAGKARCPIRSLVTASIPAATVIVMRNAAGGGAPEILMQVRSRDLTFAGGAAVFPGGRVDPSDQALAAEIAAADADADELAHRIAAIRETLEETGLVIGIAGPLDAARAVEARRLLDAQGALGPVLAAMGWKLDTDALVPFARWHPVGERLPRIFDTRFYLHDLGTGAVDIEVDAQENTRLFWASADEALAMTQRGEIATIFPTTRNLERLALFASFDEARAQAVSVGVKTIVPEQVVEDGKRWLTIPEDAGYPVTRVPLERVQRG